MNGRYSGAAVRSAPCALVGSLYDYTTFSMLLMGHSPTFRSVTEMSASPWKVAINPRQCAAAKGQSATLAALTRYG
jgi:hypothetical protein